MGNVEKLRRNGAPATPIHKAILDDIATKNSGHPDSTTQAFVWLKRILRFTAAFFDNLVQRRDLELNDCLVKAYEVHLGPHHNQIFRYMAASVLAIVPPVAEFAEALGHRSLTQLRPDMRRWVDAAKPPLRDLDAYFRSVRLER